MGITYKKFILLFYVILLVLFGVNTVNAQIRIGSGVIKLNLISSSLSEVLKQIEKQSAYKFNFDSNEINLNQKGSVTNSADLKQTLEVIGGIFNLKFDISGSTISVAKGSNKPESNERMISGLVTGIDGEVIPGTNIYIKGTRQGAVTNSKGEFTFKLIGNSINEVVLVFNYIGMKTKEVTVGGNSFFRVELEDDVLGMNEVVVTSSYTKEKRREDVVGSISQLSAVQLQTDRPIESFDKMLEGMVAGVHVETNTELNTPVRINIRGQGSLPSFNASRGTSAQPLFVIDGIPAYEQQRGNESSVFNGESYLNPLSNINPDDIKSISILKDATASALYGANAANGVIIITTKGGTAGHTKFNFSYDTGISKFINEYKWLSGPEYYSLLRETYVNGGRSVLDATQLAGNRDIDTDWFGLTNRNAVYQNAGLNISGGADKTTYRFSTGYLNQKAGSLGNDLQKFYVRLRVDQQLAEKFKVGFNISPTFTKSSNLTNYGSVLLPPNISPYNEDGSYADILGVPNPLAVLDQNENSNKGVQVMANANASYQLTKEMALSATVGADAYQNKQTQFQSALNATGRTVNGSLRIYDRNYFSYTSFVQGTYDKTFEGKHTIGFLLGTQIENKDTELLRGSGSGFTFDRLHTLGAASIQSAGSSKSSSANISYYGQLAYDLNKKYYANINGRLDKSSLFGGDRQVAFNGSVGLGWIVSKEGFLQNNSVISFLKLRSTYGSTGNSRIGNYSARGLYDFGTASGNTYNGNVAANPSSSAAPNPDLGWEKNHKLNFGVDATIFKSIQLTAEYFSNTISDLISSVNVPYETGFTTISANTGKMRNSGFELTIGTEVLNRKNFNWNVAYNLGTNKNRILAFNNGYASLYSTSDEAAALKVGESSTAIYGYKWAGVNPETGAEQFYDANGELKTASQINALPITATGILGDRLPDFQGGLINSFRLYDFNFSFNILYSYGASKLINYADESDGRNLQNRNQSVNLLDRWQRPGDVTDIPRLLITRNIVANSSRYLYDVSYLKLSNVSVGYKLSDHTARRLSLNNASLFANASNLFYVYKDAGTKGRNGIAERRFVYPESMAITLGIKIGL